MKTPQFLLLLALVTLGGCLLYVSILLTGTFISGSAFAILFGLCLVGLIKYGRIPDEPNN